MPTLDDFAQGGIAAINEHRFDDAIEQFTQALGLAPDRPDMNNALGMAYLHRGEVGSALPHLEKAVTLADQFSDAEHGDMKVHFLSSLATAYQLSDRITDARRVLADTARRFPSSRETKLQLGQLLLTSCLLEEGLVVYGGLAKDDAFDADEKEAAQAVHDAARALLDSVDDTADVFLRAHRESYATYFDDIASEQPTWYAEAARMTRGEDGEPKPVLTTGARPYAMTRVDLVNPETGEVAGVYSDTEPMIVAVEGLEPLAQLPIMFPWKGAAIETWVCTQVPWHWMTITIQLAEPMSEEARVAAVDPTIGEWYLAGFNGDFGDADKGRFHYIGPPDTVGDRALAYTVDLGRASYEAVEDLVKRLGKLSATTPVRRVLFGNGYLPD